jgi:hypothetical protein
MSYGSTIRGEITIHPPLSWDEYRDSPFRNNNRGANGKDVGLIISRPGDSDPELPIPPMDGGPEFVAIGLCNFDEERFSRHGLTEQLEEFARLYGANHYFNGYLVRVGEESGDIERFTIVDGALVSEQAELRWADGTIIDYEDYRL